MSNAPAAAKAKPGKDPALVHRKPLKTRLKENWQLYLLLLIPVIITIVYKYGPMYGIQIAFRDFKASRGIWGSEWVGLEWFERFFSSPNCGRMIVNTVLISLYSLLWSFPVPIILALALNQLRYWMQFVDDTTCYPIDCVFTAEELDAIDRYRVDFEGFVAEQEAAWLRDGGITDETWAAYKENLNSYGMDKLLEAYQSAYDRYAETAGAQESAAPAAPATAETAE